MLSFLPFNVIPDLVLYSACLVPRSFQSGKCTASSSSDGKSTGGRWEEDWEDTDLLPSSYLLGRLDRRGDWRVSPRAGSICWIIRKRNHSFEPRPGFILDSSWSLKHSYFYSISAWKHHNLMYLEEIYNYFSNFYNFSSNLTLNKIHISRIFLFPLKNFQ